VIVGFTGARNGMTDSQRGAVTAFLRAWHVLAFVHGDCIGSDDDADSIAFELNLPRVLRPGKEERYRAHGEKRGGNVLKVYPAMDFLLRNGLIVKDSHIMLATPAGPETTRSGTWSTVRRARDAKKHIVVIFPSGQLKHEGL
jgi:hypothetical protein